MRNEFRISVTGAEIKTYGYKPASLWTTGPIFMKIGTEYYFYQNDHLGTPQMLTDQSGAIVWSADYDSFGEASISVAAVENNLRFPGQYYDEETGLHYNWNRYYGPEVGRYLQNDPIGFAGGINTYLYAEGNALRYIDPFGLWAKRCSRKLGSKDEPATNQRWYNLLRHDYLNVSGTIFSFQAGSNMFWSQGRIDDDESQDKGCRMVCDDDKFDKYVFEAAKEVGALTYCVTAYPGKLPYTLGDRNCQTWVDDVLKKAKRKYLQNEQCPKCFK